MAILSGDKIERLLWENGYDFEHKTGIDGFSSIDVFIGDMVVNISETWEQGDDWHIDPDTLVFEKYHDGQLVDESYEWVEDEASLVDYLAIFGG